VTTSHRFRRYRRWALVTGAAEGLGAAFAEALAEEGLDLLLVDRQEELLEATAERLHEGGAEVRTVAADLGRDDGLDATITAAEELEVGLLVCSAGLGPIGPFLEQERSTLEEVVAVNCKAPLVLCHSLGRSMARRGRGGIVLVSSLSGLQGTALVAAYAATKAFDLILGEALWEELRHEGVDVLTACLGPTRTPAWERSKPQVRGPFGPSVMEPREVVDDALEALGRGGPTHVTGGLNRLVATVTSRLLPRRFAVSSMGRTMRSLYGRRQP